MRLIFVDNLIKLSVASSDEDLKPLDTSNPSPDQPEVAAGKMVTIMPDGRMYEIDMDMAELTRLSEGMQGRAEFEAPESHEELEPKAWSGGVDNRVRYTNPVANSSNRKIGVISPNNGAWCTGVLFDPRLVLTNYHCLFDSSGNLVTVKFRAAQDAGSRPYGEVGRERYHGESAFTANNCHTNWQAQCTKWDWAVVVLTNAPRDASFNTPGYMNYAWNSNDATAASWTKYHRGYPDCAAAGAPVGCISGAMYGQASVTTGAFSYPVNGYNRRMAHGADINLGHSGGPLFSFTPGANGPYIIGLQSSETANCYGGCQLAHPSYALRLSFWHGDQMNYYRSIYI